MPALVESLAYVSNEENNRFVPWHGLGTPVEKAMTSKEAIELAGLNWKVHSTPVFANGVEIPGWKANMRDTDNACLGMVKSRYQVVQNQEAFDFTDALIGEGCTYETAGSLDGGKRIFLLARMPQTEILGDKVDPFLAFTNGFDGYYSIKAVATPVRVVCQNTLNLALDTASRSWSTKHVGDLKSKLDEARMTLNMAQKYMDRLADTADMLANTKISEEDVVAVLDKLYPTNEEDSDRKKLNIQEQKDNFMICMVRPDILKFKDTAWGMVQAASDFATHTVPKHARDNYAEKNFGKVLDGHIVIDTVFAEMLKKAKAQVSF